MRGEARERERRVGMADTYVGSLFFDIIFQDVPEDVYGRVWLDGDTCLHSILMDVTDEFLG